MKTPRRILLIIVWVFFFSSFSRAVEIKRAGESLLSYPRLFLREQLNGNALFNIEIPTPGAPTHITFVDATESKVIEHAENTLARQKWKIPEDARYPLSFEVICSYHYMTKRFFIWLDPGLISPHNPRPFEELTGKPVPSMRLELPVPDGEERKAIVLKIPVIISKMGRVRFINPEKRKNTQFHEAAYSALDQLIFTPPIHKGRPVDTEVVLPVVFKPE